MSWLDTLLLAVRRVRSAGDDVTQRYALNFGSGLTVTDEPNLDQITVTASGGGSVTGTLPIVVTGSDVSINPATDSDAGSMSAADKTALDEIIASGRPLFPTSPDADSDVIDIWTADEASGASTLANALGHNPVTWSGSNIIPGSRRVWAGRYAARIPAGATYPAGSASLSASVNGDAGCSIEFLTILESAAIAHNAVVFSIDDGTNANILYAYRNGDHNFYFGVRVAGGTYQGQPATPPPNDTPLHVMVTAKRTAGSWAVKLYFNGVLVGTVTASAANATFSRAVVGSVSDVVGNDCDARVNCIMVHRVERAAAYARANSDLLLGF